MNKEFHQGTGQASEALQAAGSDERKEGTAVYDAEVRRFQNLLREDPGYAYRRCGLGLLYSLPGETMVGELQKFGWKARDAQDLFNCGALRSEQGDHKGALKYYEKAVEIDPKHWNTFYNMALTYQELGEPRKAQAAMQKCVKILEDKTELYSWEKEDLENARGFLQGR